MMMNSLTNFISASVGSDALLRGTTSGICGNDLHMYNGRTPLDNGTVVGDEIMGVIDEVGDAVQSIKQGNRIVLPSNNACGFCFIVIAATQRRVLP